MAGKKRKRGAQANNAAEDPSSKKLKAESGSAHTVSRADKDKLFNDKSPFAEELTRDDHERERQLYKFLASEDADERARAAETIISSLTDGDGAPEAVFKRHLERRLFRGLTSGNDAARVGFSYVLTEITRKLFGKDDVAATRYPNLSFTKFMDLLLEKTQTGGGMPGQEERDHLFGRLFGLTSFIQSGVLFDDASRWLAVLSHLLDLALKKTWIRSQCGFVVAQALPQMDQKSVKKTLAKVAEAGLAKTPEGLGLWVAAQDHHPKLKLPEPWADPLASKSLQEIAAVLKGNAQDVAQDGPGVKTSQANATTQLHFVWDLILSKYAKAGSKDAENFKLFWNRVVDQGYFSKNASDHQKLTGFKLFLKALQVMSGEEMLIQELFSKNLMACVMNQASNPAPRLHRAAVQMLKSIEKQVEEKPNTLVPTLRQLVGQHGAFNFDERVKGTDDGTRPVEKILRSASRENGQAVLDILKGVTLSTLKSNPEEQKPLQVYADYLFRLATRTTSSADEEKGESVAALAFRELAGITYPGLESPYPIPSEKTREKCLRYLTSAAASLLKRRDDFRSLCKVVLGINIDAVPMSDEVTIVVVSAKERLRYLLQPSSRSAHDPAREGLAVLHAIAVLQIYSDPAADAFEILHDTEKCWKKMEAKEKDQSDLGETLVEVLLSMLANSSAVARQASLQIFEAFSPYMSKDALVLLTDILAAKENSEGYKALFSGEGEDDVEEDDDDVEVMSIDGAEEDADDDEADDDSDSDSGSNADEDEDEDADANPDLEKLLRETFKVPDNLVADPAADSDSDADMTDSEMLALDDKLAGHLKLLKSKGGKKQAHDNKNKVIEFKHRVLDLLEVYIKQEAPRTNPATFTLLRPLLELMRATKEGPLIHKAARIIGEMQKLLKKGRKAEGGLDVNVEEALEMLEEVHSLAADPSESKAYSVAVSNASMAIVATVLAADGSEETYTKVAQVYRATEDMWYLEKLPIRASFFADWLNWRQSMRQGVQGA